MDKVEKLVEEKDGGLLTENKEYTYKKGLYYVNSSGLLCRMPDQIEAREEIHSEYYDEDDGSNRIRS